MSRLAGVVTRLQVAATWGQCKRIFAENKDLLLTDEAERWLARAAAAEEQVGKNDGSFSLYLDLLRQCRISDMDTAFDKFRHLPRKFADMGEKAAEELGEFSASRRALKDLTEARSALEFDAVVNDQLPILKTATFDNLIAGFADEAVKSGSDDLRRLLVRVQLAVVNARKNDGKAP